MVAVRVVRLPGVFLPRTDTRLLAGAMRRLPQVRGGTVLDVCTGSGVVAIAASVVLIVAGENVGVLRRRSHR